MWQAQLPLPALLFPLSAPYPEGENSSKAKGLDLCHPWALMSGFVTSTAAGAARCCRNSVFSPGISPNSPLPFSCTSQPKQDSQEKRNAGTETSEEVGKSSRELLGRAAALGALIPLRGIPIPRWDGLIPLCGVPIPLWGVPIPLWDGLIPLWGVPIPLCRTNKAAWAASSLPKFLGFLF